MTLYRPPSARRPRRRARTVLIVLAALLVGGVLFVLGVGLGQALEENPEPGGTQTIVQTLKPLPLPPARETVTVTTGG